jgi:virginiamycin B lyase
MTLAGTVTEFTIPTRSAGPWEIERGPDGNLWYTLSINRIGRITPAGVVDQFLLPGPPPTITAAAAEAVAAGPDGIWFTQLSLGKVGYITP